VFKASYVDVGLLESLGLIGLPDHVALGGVGVKANPSLELVIGRHACGVCGVVDWCGAKVYSNNSNLKSDNRGRCLSRASLHGSIFEAPPRHHHPRFDGDNHYRRQIVKNPCERPRAVWR
jgi:hypothetical protein